jgi:hypothetical protein
MGYVTETIGPVDNRESQPNTQTLLEWRALVVLQEDQEPDRLVRPTVRFRRFRVLGFRGLGAGGDVSSSDSPSTLST